jgi:glycolate oxidase FAD binding subunit
MNIAGSALSLERELAGIVGAEHVQADTATRQSLALDAVEPAHIVSPASAEEVAAVLRLASANDLVVVPAGGCTQQTFGTPPGRVDILLRTDRLRQVEHFDAGDLTVGVGAGTTIAEVQAMLEPHRLWLPLDIAQPRRATVGGVLATAAHGPLRHAYGGVRDFCIGIRFVTGDGRLAKAGGRVVKNVAGYDLMKLLIGSHGTLGVVTAASFKLFPQPSGTRTFVGEFASLDDAMRFRDFVLRSPLTPLCLEIASPRAQEYLQDAPPAHDPDTFQPEAPLASADRWRVLVRAGGVETALARYRSELGSAVSAALEGAEETRLWHGISAFAAEVAARHRNAMLMHVSVPIASVAAALDATERAALEHNFIGAAIGRIGVGALVAVFIPLATDPPSAMQFANAASSLRAALPPDSAAVVARCPLEAKPHFNPWGSTPTDLASMRAVKRALDSAAVLNRGRFLV